VEATDMDIPSTAWQERIAPGETERYQSYAQIIAGIQKQKSARYGTGRALHRKPILALNGSFTVAGDLPDYARHGLFARPGSHEAWIRLSNGGVDRAADHVPDIRGFALKIFGVHGPGALDDSTVDSQDFLLINHRAFSFPNSGEFIALVQAAAAGKAALLGHLIKSHGVFGGLGRAKKLAATLGKPFAGFAAEEFFTATPLACGPYAMRVRLRPLQPAKPAARASADWGADFMRQLGEQGLRYALGLQFFRDEARTPIEDASVDWPEAVAPYVEAGVLSIPPQAAEPSFTAKVEAARFDPWNALAEHRPLGDVMRARKFAYYASQKGRGLA
jgi:hypothetical protein